MELLQGIKPMKVHDDLGNATADTTNIYSLTNLNRCNGSPSLLCLWIWPQLQCTHGLSHGCGEALLCSSTFIWAIINQCYLVLSLHACFFAKPLTDLCSFQWWRLAPMGWAIMHVLVRMCMQGANRSKLWKTLRSPSHIELGASHIWVCLALGVMQGTLFGGKPHVWGEMVEASTKSKKRTQALCKGIREGIKMWTRSS